MKAPLRSRLLAGAAALGAFLLPGAASGQAFDGTPITVHGIVSRFTEPGKETLIVETPSAVVNWIPNSNAELTPFDFLPAGNVATFRNGDNQDFMILNRILPDNNRPIAFNGTVISQLVSNSGTVPGGTVVFYTPGGILIGGTAVFDVGNLLLTTIDPVVGQNGDFFAGNTYQLSSAAIEPGSFVRIQPGARIDALGPGSYIAAAAPIIQQSGIVRANGSIAYVAAEQVRLTIDNGLFDIEVQTGSSSAVATIDHRGSTGGPASDGFGDNHVIYMVAVPKNDAVSLLLRGNAGYDVAAGTVEENGAIILTAGYDVNLVAPMLASPVEARIDIRQANITSNLIGFATASAVGTAFGGEALRFAGDVTLVAPEANLGSEGGALAVGGDAVVTAGRGSDFSFAAVDGGQASLFARGGGTVQIGGDARVSASALSPAGQAARGGSSIVTADDGAIAVAGSLRVEADAEGGGDDVSGAGGATGGTARIAALNRGAVAVAGEAEVSASATGGASFAAGSSAGGALGGDAGVSAASNGRVSLGALSVRATGTGGSAFAGNAAAGTGGEARIEAVGGGRVAVTGSTRLDSGGLGGTGLTESPPLFPDVSGAAGRGGSARILVAGGTVQLDMLAAAAIGTGGAVTGAGTGGGEGAGGLVELNVAGGALAARESVLEAFGAFGAGGAGTGGNIVAAAAGGAIAGEGLTARAGADATLAGVAMTQLLDVTAQRRVSVTGPVFGRTMSLASRDIDIAAGASLGGAATGQILLRVLESGNQTVVGGTAAGPGYTLDRNELARVRAGQLRILAPAAGNSPGRPPDVLIDSLTLAAELQPDGFAFELVTPGTARVVGDVLMSGAGDGDRLSLSAGERFEVIAPAGSIRVRDGAGNPAGALAIGSANIVVADAALAAQLKADPNFTGRDLALLLNPAPANPAGYVEAGAVGFAPIQQGGAAPATLFVQNTGPNFANLAGVTVGAGGLTISPVGLATVAGFGRRQNGDGGFTTGDAFFRLAAFDRSTGSFTGGSEFNLCNINSGLCPPRLPGAARPALTRIVLGPLLPPQAEPRDDVIDAAALSDIPLIDEPVTSGGDSSLWDGDVEEEDEE